MSRIGKKSIPISKDTAVTVNDQTVNVKGKKGGLSFDLPSGISITIEESLVSLTRKDDQRQSKSLHGMSRSMVANMIAGVETGFKKELIINGVGYRSQVKGKVLILNLGYSHPVEFDIPKDITITVTDNIKIAVEGIDRQEVGQVAAVIRGFRKPEPYKGKGIRYADEQILRKEGKSV